MVCLISCTAKELPVIVDVDKNYAEVKISHEATEKSLQIIQSDLKNIANIEMDFSKSTFLDDGRIQDLKITVTLPNGQRGSTQADLMTLQYKYYGFKYDPESQPIFVIGHRP